jgi:hypothetical protein
MDSYELHLSVQGADAVKVIGISIFHRRNTDDMWSVGDGVVRTTLREESHQVKAMLVMAIDRLHPAQPMTALSK